MIHIAICEDDGVNRRVTERAVRPRMKLWRCFDLLSDVGRRIDNRPRDAVG